MKNIYLTPEQYHEAIQNKCICIDGLWLYHKDFEGKMVYHDSYTGAILDISHSARASVRYYPGDPKIVAWGFDCNEHIYLVPVRLTNENTIRYHT